MTSCPDVPISRAVFFRVVAIWAGESAELASSISAATAAACGAAAEVPKKLGYPFPSESPEPKNVVSVLSMADKSGLSRTSGEALRVPSALNRMVVGPCEVDDSG